MMNEYIWRSLKQLKRYPFRSGVMFVSVLVMVIVFTGLLNIAWQMNSFFQQTGMDYTQKLKVIRVSAMGEAIDNRKINQIAEIEGVQAVLPTAGYLNIPWLNITMNPYQVLPSNLMYYDPNYAKYFADDSIMLQVSSGEPGVIVSSDFASNLMSLEDYKSMFNLEESVSQEFMEAGTIRLIKQYQKRNLSGPEELADRNLIGRQITFHFQNKYLTEDYEDKKYEVPIAGVLKSDFLIDKNTILVPRGIFGNNRSEFRTLYVQAESIELVEPLTEAIAKLGLRAYGELGLIKGMLENRERLLNQLMLIMTLVLLLAFTGLISCWQSILRERRGEMAIMKALGASSEQITKGFLLEGIILIGSATIVGLSKLSLIFTLISNRISANPNSASSNQVTDLGPDAVRYLFEIPYTMYLFVLVLFIGFSLLITYLTIRSMFRMNYLTLLKKG